MFLHIVRKVTVKARVTSGISGKTLTTANLLLYHLDASGTGVVEADTQINGDKKTGDFVISGVTPGTYLLEAYDAEDNVRLTAREILTVSENDVPTVELVAQMQQPWRGTIVTQGGGPPLDRSKLHITMEPRSERGATVSAAIDTADKSEVFDCKVDPEEMYDLYVDGLSDDYYIAGIRVNGVEALASGIAGSQAGATSQLQVTLDSRGSRVAGRVFGPDGSVWSGATVMLIPDPPETRWQAYRSASADEYGQFTLHGIPPGHYILVAWLDEAPCDASDATALDGCRSAGMSLDLQMGDSPNVELDMKTPRR